MKRSILLFILFASLNIALIGCNFNSENQTQKNESEQQMEKPVNDKEETNRENTYNQQVNGEGNSVKEKQSEWEIISRQRYVEGTVTDIIVNSEKVQSIRILEEKFYGTETDPLGRVIDKPTGENEYVLKQKYKKEEIPISKGDKIIIFYSQVSTNGEQVLGGGIISYSKNGVYYNLKGERTNIEINKDVKIKDGILVINQ